MDPTRTTLLRQRFVRAMDKGFDALKKAVIQLVEKEDAFGLKAKSHDPNSLVTHTRYQALTQPQQLAAFKRWVQGQIDSGILKGVDTGAPNWLEQYIREAYEKGAGRSFDDYMAKYKDYYGKPQDYYAGTKGEFMRSAFRTPASEERVRLLASRTYTDLKGVTDAMSTKMNRVLTDSIIQGRSPRDTARALAKEVEGIGKNRARTIARTETIRAHADGQLEALKKLGVEEVGVMVEWSTASDDLVCDLCADMDGAVLRIQDAGILIPRHPNCRCAWLPANVGEDPTRKVWYEKDDKGKAIWQDLDQKRGADAKAAIDKSIKREIPKSLRGKRSLKEQKELSRWMGAERTKLAKPLKSPLDDLAKAPGTPLGQPLPLPPVNTPPLPSTPVTRSTVLPKQARTPRPTPARATKVKPLASWRDSVVQEALKRGPADAITIPDLYRQTLAINPQLSLAEFKQGLLELHQQGRLSLMEYTRAPFEIMDKNYKYLPEVIEVPTMGESMKMWYVRRPVGLTP